MTCFTHFVFSAAFRFQLLAQGEAPGEGAEAPAFPIPPWVPFALIGIVIYFMLIRPSSRERKQQQELLKNLKKNDRVMTIGGIYGTVVEVKPDRVTLRVDDSSNTRMQMSRGSISRLITDEKGADKEGEGKEI